jgi:hypothetical protein
MGSVKLDTVPHEAVDTVTGVDVDVETTLGEPPPPQPATAKSTNGRLINLH